MLGPHSHGRLLSLNVTSRNILPYETVAARLLTEALLPSLFPLDSFGVSISASHKAPHFPMGSRLCRVLRAHQMVNLSLQSFKYFINDSFV